jgi:hypothetical protein
MTKLNTKLAGRGLSKGLSKDLGKELGKDLNQDVGKSRAKNSARRTKKAAKEPTPADLKELRSSGAQVAHVAQGAATPAVELAPDTPPAQLASTEAVSGIQFGPEWVELAPSGISIAASAGTTGSRPVLIFKDQTGLHVLPVWMNPLDAGVALSELTGGSGATPHVVARRMMEALKIQPEVCAFIDLVGHHQYVLLSFKGETSLGPLRVRADEAMSFCLQSKVKFYSTPAYMARCRDLDAEIETLESKLSKGALQGLVAEADFSSKKHPYMM